MAVKMRSEYLGEFQTQMEHLDSGDKYKTDLPKDNGGQGRTFSPTDLLAGALSSCVLTIMGKVADRDGVDLKGTVIELEKHMQDKPRRVSKIEGKILFPEQLSDKYRAKYLKFINSCPVGQSLHPDIEVNFSSE